MNIQQIQQTTTNTSAQLNDHLHNNSSIILASHQPGNGHHQHVAANTTTTTANGSNGAGFYVIQSPHHQPQQIIQHHTQTVSSPSTSYGNSYILTSNGQYAANGYQQASSGGNTAIQFKQQAQQPTTGSASSHQIQFITSSQPIKYINSVQSSPTTNSTVTNPPRYLIHQAQQASTASPQQIQNQQHYIVNNTSISASPVSSAQFINSQNGTTTTTGGGGQQIYLNINNRLIPVQQNGSSVQATTSNYQQVNKQQIHQQSSSSPVSQRIHFLQPAESSQSTTTGNNAVSVDTNVQSGSQQYFLIANNNNNAGSNLNSELSEKTRQMEQVQMQLRQYHAKILASAQSDPSQLASSTSSGNIVLTQQQIQAALTQPEQVQLQRLLVQKKAIESEIVQLKQKGAQITQQQTVQQQSTTTTSASQQLSKLQLLQQITLKLNNLKQAKTQINESTGQQQLVMTQEEFDQMKKLMELQSKLAAECKAESATTSNTTTTAVSSATSSLQNNLLRQQLQEKQKLLELVKQQLDQVKHQSQINSGQMTNDQQQKYMVLSKKQLELSTQIAQMEKQLGISSMNTNSPSTQKTLLLATTTLPDGTQQTVPLDGTTILNIGNQNQSPTVLTANMLASNSANKQTPIKIRNVITNIASPSNSALASHSPSSSSTTTPLRTLVLNANASMAGVSSTSTINATSTSVNSLNVPTVLPAHYAIALHKQYFPHVQFKCLNFEELAQHSVITKQTDELTLTLLRQLDEKASTVINQEQKEAFAKNQVRIVKKYLEAQLQAKQVVRNRMIEQLDRDQRLVINPDYKTQFVDRNDAIKRLSRYHVLQKTLYEPKEEDSQKFDECFEQVSERLLRIADAMKKRFHLYQLRSMQKPVATSEETQVLKLFVEDLKQQVAAEKLVKQSPEATTTSTPTPIKTVNSSSSFSNISTSNSNTYLSTSVTNSPTTIKQLILQKKQQQQQQQVNSSADFVLNTSSLNIGLKRANEDTRSEDSQNTKAIKLDEQAKTTTSGGVLPLSSIQNNNSINLDNLVESKLKDSCGDVYKNMVNGHHNEEENAATTLNGVAYNSDEEDEEEEDDEDEFNDDEFNGELIQPGKIQQNSLKSSTSAVGLIDSANTNSNAIGSDSDPGGLNNLSGLDELLLANEDELAVQSILNFS